jgi:uncharacterized RDD family membrane protein YckC
MQVWGVRVQNADGSRISCGAVALCGVDRVVAVRGAGFIWSLFDKQKRSWHDIYSDTQLVRVPKKKNNVLLVRIKMWEGASPSYIF